jgi:2-polyprenyl-6-methoxyphenol hydroxylase-like FAD-dependent oxidoreductase
VIGRSTEARFAGTEPEFTGYSAQIDLVDPEKLSPGRNLTSTGMYLQSQPGYVVLAEFDGGAAHRAEPATLERVQEALRRVSNTDVMISALYTVATWTDRARQATTYRNGRVLLAGDAAHIHSPLGGQGLKSWTRRRHEPGLEARRHHPRESAGRLVGQLSSRTTPTWSFVAIVSVPISRNRP